MREQTTNTLPTERREEGCRWGGVCCVGGPIQRVPEHQHADATFVGVSILAAVFARIGDSGPPGEVAKPSKGLKELFLVIAIVRDLGGHRVVVAMGSKGVVIPLMEPVPVSGFCDHASGTSNGIGGGCEGMAIGRVSIGWSAERIVETTGQTDVVLLRPGRGEAGYADGERATRDGEPRRPGGRLEGPLLIVSIGPYPRNGADGPEGIAVDGLIFEIGFIRAVADPGNGGSRESEPRNIGDV